LPRDEAPAEHRDQHRERERHAADDERRARGSRAQSRGRDGERRPRRANRRSGDGVASPRHQ
jgi:hypothetical protein